MGSYSQPQSSVLIIGHPKKEKVQLGAHCVDTANEALPFLTSFTYSTIVFNIHHLDLDSLKTFLTSLQTHSKKSNIIIVHDHDDKEKLLYSINHCNLFKLIKAFDEPEFEKHIFSSNEHFAQIQQNRQLMDLFNEQNTKLKSLKKDLESRIKKRKKSLINSQKRYENLSLAVQALHKSLIIIHKAKSIHEIESHLVKSLSLSFPVTHIKIHTGEVTTTTNENSSSLFEISLPLLIRQEMIGEVIIHLKEKRDLTKDDHNFLTQIAEAIALATDRLTMREKSKVLKNQWEAAFNAIKDPICLTNSRFQIIRTNDSFLKNKISNQLEINGENCFKIFFEDKNVLKTSHKMGDTYFFQKTQSRLADNNSRTFDVTVQKIPYLDLEHDLWLIYFRDVTEELKLERQILESSKMAELGTISSSIAHELNNPLGGMISFLQLIKMDLTPESPVLSDINAMLDSALRCKDIISNLLGFARRSKGNIDEKINLIDVLKQSLKIIELQTKSTNIQMELVNHTNSDIIIDGNYNLLTQAICNILTNSVESIKAKFSDSPRYDGQIRVEVDLKPNRIQVIISDNGTGIKPEHQSLVFNPLFTTKNPDHNAGLGLTVSFQIINEHSGTLDIFSQPIAGTSAKISFLRPDLSA